MYIGDPAASISRPVRELRGFSKVTLAPGESKTVSFDITTEQLCFYNSSLKKVWEPGLFNLYIGKNSSETLNTTFEWEE